MLLLHINCNYIGSALHQLMIEKLNNIGCNNIVFAPTYNKKISVIQPNENVIVSECFKKWDRLFFDYKQRKIIRSLETSVDVSKVDCIHAYTLFTDGNCARKIAKKYNKPYVVAIRNTDVNDFFKLMPFLRHRGVSIMRDAKKIFFLSEAYRKQVLDKYVPKKLRKEIYEKSLIVPNGIDDFWLKNLKTDSKKLLNKDIKLIFAGRIDRNKNIETIQRAVKILRK